LTPATLVLLPGLDGTEIFLQPLLGALPDGVRPLVVTYPLAGPNRYADLLAVVREAVAGIGEFHVLGWSFSGPLALMLANAEPQRVRSVILSASFVRPPRPELAMLRFALREPVIWLWREVMKVDAREALRACRQPVLYLAASRDGIVPRRCIDEILSVRPAVKVVTIEGEHFAMYANPQAAARAITAFIS